MLSSIASRQCVRKSEVLVKTKKHLKTERTFDGAKSFFHVLDFSNFQKLSKNIETEILNCKNFIFKAKCNVNS